LIERINKSVTVVIFSAYREEKQAFGKYKLPAVGHYIGNRQVRRTLQLSVDNPCNI